MRNLRKIFVVILVQIVAQFVAERQVRVIRADASCFVTSIRKIKISCFACC